MTTHRIEVNLDIDDYTLFTLLATYHKETKVGFFRTMLYKYFTEVATMGERDYVESVLATEND